MGHHFASIAGAAPIIGPVVAAVFGWIPVLLWILIGSIFLGGVHDFSALATSFRHGGKTIGGVIEEHVGKAGCIAVGLRFPILLSYNTWKVVLFDNTRTQN